ncbi:DEKNAAC101286 [Brettanomyces naardenensis]|uniref:DEKNAAC101286 n=1 Tax=Brettanomyces naardenensis TaxID=13370 RepID=A0A448YHX2_BRENA|nr:DEKNAAC101286 [Brettanomyces naardenensis]
MSDPGRKNLSDKFAETVTPDSQKSSVQKAKETVTGEVDKVASSITPDSQKSFTQAVSDKAQSGSDKVQNTVHQDRQGFKEAAEEYLEAGKKRVDEAAEYISGVVGGAKKGGEESSSK